jgi:PTH1 family peptidyl-tRNA hydrolase
MIRILANCKLKAGTKDEALKLVSELVALTREENGCIEYVFCESDADADEVAFFEAWESDEALDAHSNSEHFKRIVPQIGALVVGEMTVSKFKPLV